MATRKRKQDEELVALPSDESEEEEEYVVLPSNLLKCFDLRRMLVLIEVGEECE